jgi:hypothetical protein
MEGEIMPNATIIVVNHTSESNAWMQGLANAIRSLFGQCLAGSNMTATVAVGTATANDNFVVHLVEDVNHSYLQTKMPGQGLRADIGGHTRTQGGTTGTEIYLYTGASRSRATYTGYAKLTVHEALHNLFPGWTAGELHGPNGGGGLALSPPHLPPTATNKEMIARGLSIRNAQLL